MDKLKILLPRARDAHKGNFGHVLVIGGDYGMGGAVRMCAEAAARIGAGLVSVTTRPEHVTAINIARPEIMCNGLKALDRVTVIVIGPGLGQTSWGKKLLRIALKENSKPIVVDADALNILAQKPQHKNNWILTPHPGEAARLLNTTVETIQGDRNAAVKKIQKTYGGVCVLKGAGTLITDGKKIAKCKAGNPGMASGGMGDILSGIIGGLLAQKLSLFDAANLGVEVHATAGDLAAKEFGERGMLAMDLLLYLRKLIN